LQHHFIKLKAYNKNEKRRIRYKRTFRFLKEIENLRIDKLTTTPPNVDSA